MLINKERKNKKSFTLAELMIVISIIGVIATLSINAGIKHYQRTVMMARLKEAYSLLEQATTISRQSNFDRVPNGNQEADWRKFIVPYLRIIHDCGQGDKDPRCFAGPRGGWYKSNGKAFNYNDNGYGTDYFHKAILANGMSIAFRSCGTCMGLHNIIVIDIDGPQKGYSRMGSDVFVFEWARVNSDKGGWDTCKWRNQSSQPELLPYVPACKHWQDGGYYSSLLTDNGNSGAKKICLGGDGAGDWWNMQAGKGTTCAAWIMHNNWKLPDDYPLSKFSQKPADFKRPKPIK